jgi:hypothetical protein
MEVPTEPIPNLPAYHTGPYRTDTEKGQEGPLYRTDTES